MSRLPSQKERCVHERGEHCKELEYEHLHCKTPFNGRMGVLILCKQQKKQTKKNNICLRSVLYQTNRVNNKNV